MDSQGNVYVLELNPLPGLTPEHSDLVLIGTAAAMDYRTLIAEILAGGLKRLREKRRDGGMRSGNHTRASRFEGSVSSLSPESAASPVEAVEVQPKKPAKARSRRPVEAPPSTESTPRKPARKKAKSSH